MSSSVREKDVAAAGAPTDAYREDAADRPTWILERPARRVFQRLPHRVRRMLPDATAYTVFLVLAVWTCGRLWKDPQHRVSGHLPADHIQFESWLVHAAYSVIHLQNPLFSHQVNVPLGVNAMANTSVLGIGIPLTPVTLLFGPQVSYAVYLTLALAGSAAAGYHVLSRHLVRSRLAAFVGGGFFGFAPGIIHHANGQPNFVTNFLLPFIVLRVLRLREPGRAVRHGVVLGLLVTWQVFINEELLLLTALGMAFVVGLYAVLRRAEAGRDAKQFLRAGAVAVGCAAVLLAYPVWFQFAGSQHYHGIQPVFGEWGEDVTAWFTFSRDTLAGTPAVEATIGKTEQNSWFGLPLVALLAIAAVLMWRRGLAARITTVTGVVFALLATGPVIRFDGHQTGIPGPWRLLSWFPLLRYMYPSRVVFIVIACGAVLLALACDTLPGLAVSGFPVRFGAAWWVLVAVALVPIVPKPMPGVGGPHVPAFISNGDWRRYVDSNHTLVSVPLGNDSVGLKSVYWQTISDQRYKVPGGYFLGPDPTGTAMFGAPHRPTTTTIYEIDRTGKAPVVTPKMHQQTIVDLRDWRAAIVVMDTVEPRDELKWKTMTALIGFEPRAIDGMWVWDVRALVSGK